MRRSTTRAWSHTSVPSTWRPARSSGSSTSRDPVIYTVTSLAYDPAAKQLFYTTDNGAHRDLVRLDPKTRETELLQKDFRIGDLAFNRADRTLWGIRHLNGISSLVRMEPPYKQWTRVHSWPYGTVVYDLDLSPDGTRLSASFGEISGQQNVRVFATDDLLQGRIAPTAEFDFGPSVPSGFVFTRDGGALVGSSYYTGVSNIFRYDLATGETSALSNAETGFFRPVPRPEDGDLFVFRYSGEGFVPTSIAATPARGRQRHHLLRRAAGRGAPGAQDVDRRLAERGAARGQAAGAGHVSAGRRDAARVDLPDHPGLQGHGRDRRPRQLLGPAAVEQVQRLGRVLGRPATCPPRETSTCAPTTSASTGGSGRTYNDANFYDLFGPTKTGRKGYTVGAGYHRTLLYDEPRRIDLDTDVMFAGNLDRLPQYQNVAIDVDRLLALDATISGRNIRSSLGRVDDEKGLRWSATVDGNRIAGQWFSRTRGTFDLGTPLPLAHSSVWLRSAAGISPGSRAEPFANFYFGGFGNNWVDRGDEKRYRDFYAFPGADLNEIGGRNFIKSTLEWNLPPLRFRRLGTPAFYATWLRPAIFVGGLVTNLDHDAFRRRAIDAGAQFDVQLTTLSTLDMMLSFGGAVAFERGAAPRREFMVSFKVLR